MALSTCSSSLPRISLGLLVVLYGCEVIMRTSGLFLKGSVTIMWKKSQEFPRNKCQWGKIIIFYNILNFSKHVHKLHLISTKGDRTQAIQRFMEVNREHWQRSGKLILLKEATSCTSPFSFSSWPITSLGE